MLLKCPECELPVSDKAINCPHCGYPLTKPPKQKYKASSKRRRLPNGFGSITELKNSRLRNRYWARISVGKDDFGRPIHKPLKPKCYFATYNDAYEALIEYHKDPYALASSVTSIELYERWSKEYLSNKKPSYARVIKSAWKYCSELYQVPVANIRARHIKAMIDGASIKDKNGNVKYPSPSSKERIKSLWNIMLDYAVEYEIVQMNYARTFELSGEVWKQLENEKRSHIAFTQKEMEKLWGAVENIKWTDLILIQCYSGMRPQELGLVKISDVNLENWTIRGGMKTKAGTNRLIPIHPAIRKYVKKYKELSLALGSEYLLTVDDGKTHQTNTRLTYDKYAYRFKEIMKVLSINEAHRPHDPRKQFVTMAKEYNVDEYAIKRIVGHTINDITEDVYTDRSIEWLHTEIQKIKWPEQI